MIYLDNSATTPPDPSLLSYLEELFFQKSFLANPSSVHSWGRKSFNLIKKAEKTVQEFLGFPGKVVFTSGATEALNIAIASLPKGHIVSSVLEHPAVIEPLQKRVPDGVTFLAPKQGRCVITVEQVEQALQSDTVAIVLGWVNSETGAKADIEEIAALAERRRILFVVDATAIVGKERVSIPRGVSAFCFSGHKMHALTGVGVLAWRPSFKMSPLLFGGGQQNLIRPGTENILGIASLEYICRYLIDYQESVSEYLLSLRMRFEQLIKELYPDSVIHCQNEERVSNISTIAFPPLEGEVLRMALDLNGIASSYGTACSSGAVTVFKSLEQIGIEPSLVAASLRFSFGRFNLLEEVERAANIVSQTAFAVKEQMLS